MKKTIMTTYGEFAIWLVLEEDLPNCDPEVLQMEISEDWFLKDDEKGICLTETSQILLNWRSSWNQTDSVNEQVKLMAGVGVLGHAIDRKTWNILE